MTTKIDRRSQIESQPKEFRSAPLEEKTSRIYANSSSFQAAPNEKVKDRDYDRLDLRGTPGSQRIDESNDLRVALSEGKDLRKPQFSKTLEKRHDVHPQSHFWPPQGKLHYGDKQYDLRVALRERKDLRKPQFSKTPVKRHHLHPHTHFEPQQGKLDYRDEPYDLRIALREGKDLRNPQFSKTLEKHHDAHPHTHFEPQQGKLDYRDEPYDLRIALREGKDLRNPQFSKPPEKRHHLHPQSHFDPPHTDYPYRDDQSHFEDARELEEIGFSRDSSIDFERSPNKKNNKDPIGTKDSPNVDKKRAFQEIYEEEKSYFPAGKRTKTDADHFLTSPSRGPSSTDESMKNVFKRHTHTSSPFATEQTSIDLRTSPLESEEET